MKFNQTATIKGGQDGAIFGKHLFRFNHKGEGLVYDLELIEKGEAEPIADVVMHYASCAAKAGLDGVVCSPLEAGVVHEKCGKGFLTVTPGVRFADGDIGDQKRVMTPAEAKKIGSDYIVVGRPITAAADPVAAYERCVAEFCD